MSLVTAILKCYLTVFRGSTVHCTLGFVALSQRNSVFLSAELDSGLVFFSSRFDSLFVECDLDNVGRWTWLLVLILERGLLVLFPGDFLHRDLG